MPSCSICTHPQRDALLAALPHTALRTLQAQYHISKSVLHRHRQCGCPSSHIEGGQARASAPWPLSQYHPVALRLAKATEKAQSVPTLHVVLIDVTRLLVQLTSAQSEG